MSVKTVSALESGARRAPYRQTVSLLAEALALEPEQRDLLASAASRPPQRRLRLVESRADVGALPTLRHNLPAELSSLVGRDGVVADVVALVRAHRLVTLVGSGGIGKTRVALRVARRALADWPEGVWLAELAPVRDGALVVGAISQVAHERALASASLGSLVDYLKVRHVLLVLDNCEHVLNEVCNIATAALKGCANVSILATSREPLKIAGEWVYRVPSLASPQGTAHTVREASEYASVALFAERSRAAGDLELNEHNVAAVSEICRRLDGIPLAIELAAARMAVLTPAQVSDMLDQRFEVLTRGERMALPRQKTMRSALDWSYDLLSEEERLLFDRLSVFAGGFTLESAGAVCAVEFLQTELLDLLSSLVDKSLVVADRTGERTRFWLLESSRAYAAERLEERGEEEIVARRHAEAFLDLAERLRSFAPGGGPHDRDRLAEARHEQANWSAALAWSLRDRHDVVLGQRLAAVVARPGYLARDSMNWLRLALTTCDETTPRELVASLEFSTAHRLLTDGLELEASLGAAERSAAIFHELRMLGRAADAEMLAAITLGYLGRTREATELSQRVLAWARGAQTSEELLKYLQRALAVQTICRDIAGARCTYAEARRLSRESRDEPADFLANLCVNLAACEAADGDVDTALRLGAEGLGIFRRLAHPSLAGSIARMAAIYIAAGRYEEALQHALEAIAFLREQPSDINFLECLHHVATVLALRTRSEPKSSEDPARAARLLGYVTARLPAPGKGPLLYWLRYDQEHERTTTVLRATLAGEFSQLMAEGAALNDECALVLTRQV